MGVDRVPLLTFILLCVVLVVVVSALRMPDKWWAAFERFRCWLYGHCDCDRCIAANICGVCGAGAQ